MRPEEPRIALTRAGSATDRVARWVLRFRWLVLLLVGAATVLFALQIPGIRVGISPEGMRIVGHPDTLYYERYIEQYGTDERVLIELFCADVFSAEAIRALARLTESIEGYDNVDRVVSLLNANDVRGSPEGIEIAPFFGELPASREERERARRQVHDNPLTRGSLVSEDDRSTLLLVELERAEESFPRKRRELVRKVLALAERIQAGSPGVEGLEIHVGGFPVLMTVLPSLLMQDQRVFIPLVLLLIVLTLCVAFRSFWGVLLPLLTVVLSLVWTLGFLVATGKRVEIVTNVLPPLVLVIALADAVHILAHYQEERQREPDRKAALTQATAYILIPCLLTSLTTAIGFGSLVVSRIAGIRDLGILASFGVMAAFLLSMTVVPVLLSFLPARAFAGRRRSGGQGPLDRFLAALAAFNASRKPLVICVSAALIAVSVAGIFRLRVETTILKYLKEDNPLVRAIRHVEAHLTGTTTLDVVFDFGEEGAAKEPANLARVAEMSTYLEGLPLVTHSTSLVDLLARMNQVFHGGDPAFHRLPPTRDEIAQYLLLYSMSGDEEDLSRLVGDGDRTAVVASRMKSVNSARMERFIRQVRAFVAERFPDLDVQVTGISVLVTNSIGAIVRGQIQSLGLALAVISVLMTVLFRSVRLGLLSMVPNVLPILVTLGVMGWLGVSINTATALISCVAIGIAVDDTIHYLSRFRREYTADPDETRAAARALRSTGRALFFTSFVLAFGFLVLVLSSFRPLVYFGLLTGVTMVTALVGDLVLLPVLLMLARPLRARKRA